MPPAVNEAFLPANVLERKIHDIEFFKSKSRISIAEIRAYAAQHNLPLDETRLAQAVGALEPDIPARLNRILESLRRGEQAYTVLDLTTFVKIHGIKLDAKAQSLVATLQKAESKERYRLKDIRDRQDLEHMYTTVELHLRNLPFTAQQIRIKAAETGLPVDEARLKKLFGHLPKA